MGFFDFLPCCGRRTEDKHDEPSDTDPLLASRPAESITSQEGYGAISMGTTEGGLSGKQRERIAEIGREVGNHMLPINHTSRMNASPSIRQPSTARAPSPDSGSSTSRPTTPSPAGAGDELAPGDGDEDAQTSHSRSGAATPNSTVAADADGVVHKTLFHGAPNGNSKRGRGGKKGARGRGRGRSKKNK